MKRDELLNEALRIVMSKDKDGDYKTDETELDHVADLWRSYLSFNDGKASLKTYITSQDVAVMMFLLQIARIKVNPDNPDNWVNIAVQAAIGVESV